MTAPTTAAVLAGIRATRDTDQEKRLATQLRQAPPC